MREPTGRRSLFPLARRSRPRSVGGGFSDPGDVLVWADEDQAGPVLRRSSAGVSGITLRGTRMIRLPVRTR